MHHKIISTQNLEIKFILQNNKSMIKPIKSLKIFIIKNKIKENLLNDNELKNNNNFNFIIKNNEINFKKTIDKHDNLLYEIIFLFKKKYSKKYLFRILKKNLPTVFDLKFINFLNNKFYLKENINILRHSLEKLIEFEDYKELLENLEKMINIENHLKDDDYKNESSESIIDEILLKFD